MTARDRMKISLLMTLNLLEDLLRIIFLIQLFNKRFTNTSRL